MQPPDLSDEALDVWESLCDDLESGGILDRADGAMIEGAAVLLGRVREARRVLNDQGLTYESARTGAPTLRPEFRVEREAWGAFRMFAEHLGLSPVARARLGLAGQAARAATPTWDEVLGPNPRKTDTTFTTDEVGTNDDDER